MSDSDRDSTRSDIEAAAFRLLARRDHARRELAAKLRKRQFDSELITVVLDECTQSGYLDDDRARAFRHLTHRGYRPSLIRRILFDG